MNAPESETRSLAILYRCVCGAPFSVHLGEPATCPQCQRRYAAEAFRNRLAETASIALNASGEPIAVEAIAPAHEADDPRIGTRLGHFRLVGRLGMGGMGAVYQALDESLQRYVAVKLIQPTAQAPDTAHQERLIQEARAQARVSHPHVVHIYYVGRDEQSPFFAMELVAGPTLGDRLREGPLPFGEVVEIALQVVDALAHAANFDIVHGDIKPSNILLSDGRTYVKLSDFGLAQRLSRGAAAPGLAQGTPHYLPPEALRGERRDIRGDMYSLGVMLFEMTFGRLPYSVSGSNLAEQLSAHERAAPEFPSPWPAAVPERWRTLLARLLAKFPAERYATYEALAADLKALKPAALPSAGLAPRLFAWLVDLALASAAQGLFFGSFAELVGNSQGVAARSLLGAMLLSLVVASAAVPLTAAWLQSLWGISPGKRLLQLRIVNEHGLPPGRWTLGLRACWQLAPIWLASFNQLLIFLGLSPLRAVSNAAVALAVGCDALWAAFHDRGTSLHDRALGTRVVLDTQPHGFD